LKVFRKLIKFINNIILSTLYIILDLFLSYYLSEVIIFNYKINFNQKILFFILSFVFLECFFLIMKTDSKEY
jgi:uncharacterized protein YacL